MKNNRHLFRAFFLAVLLHCNAPVALAATPPAVQLKAVTEALPPLNYELNGQVVGFSSELLDMLALEAGITVQKQLLPWARAYRMALDDADTILYSLVRTPERETLFQWVGPISPRKIVLYRMATRKELAVTHLDEVRAYKVGVVRESAAAKALINKGFTVDKKLELALDDATNMRKFKAGRFDFLVSLDWAAAYNTQQNEMAPADLAAVLVLDEQSEYWFGVSLRTDPLIVRRLNEALVKVRRDGRLKALTRRHMQAP
jgi:polar amino acid transport system substrate-binding protein